MTESDPNVPAGDRPARERDGTRRRAKNLFAAAEARDSLVKQEVARDRALFDAKTAKLKALRLAKEEADREAERLAALNAPPPKPKKKKKTVGG
jgi:hypothetical protein